MVRLKIDFVDQNGNQLVFPTFSSFTTIPFLDNNIHLSCLIVHLSYTVRKI